MANLDNLEQDVDRLDESESTPFEFRDVYRDIEAAARTTDNSEINRIREILSTFRNKLPNKTILKPIRSGAQDLADTLMLATLTARIQRINDRNQALSNLNSALDVQIQKGNADANLLTDIKDKINKATETVNAIKTLINQLTATDATTKSSLAALVDTVDSISSIFEQ